MKNYKIIVEKHPDGFVAYLLGLKGVVVGQGDSYDEALADVKSAIKFHIESFGPDVMGEHISMIRENPDGTKTPLTMPNHRRIKSSTMCWRDFFFFSHGILSDGLAIYLFYPIFRDCLWFLCKHSRCV